MSPPIIEVENLSKRYRLGQFNVHTLREEVERLFRRAPQTGDSVADDSEFWALRDVSFTVAPGEVVGIIGRNGAGKSTLLKILTRVTEPTSGRAVIRGRVASLLEVGTGFHPELTGRENIYLNGAILGMTRAEIRRKFDAIVEFSEVERFVDTPVKRFSSGMYVRLAFAVAAHLEPEILLVDEVLAVGDTEFQKKCLGKMDEVAGEGRTVLFVSHNMAAVRRICDAGVLLSGGRVALQGDIGACIEHYSGTLSRTEAEGRLRFPPTSQREHHVIEVEILDDQLAPMSCLRTWEPVVFLIRFYSPQSMPNGAVTFQISSMDGSLITFCATIPDQGFGVSFDEGENQVLLRFDSIALSAGKYFVGAGLAVANTKWLYNEQQGAIIEVAAKDVYHAGFAPTQSRYPVPMACHWQKVSANEISIVARQSRT